MFSFGIFTTHLPYIMMVVFYAYFFIFGVEKVSKGEIISDSYLKIEIEKENIHSQTESGYNYYFQKDFKTIRSAVLEKFESELITKYASVPFNLVYTMDNYCYSRFSRPPPVV